MNDYDKQAQDFLKATDTTIEIKLSEFQNAPLWAKDGTAHGKKYTVTLSNPRSTYTFPFWDSIHNSEKIKALETIKDSVFGNITSETYKAQDLLKAETGKRIQPMTARRDFEKLVEQFKPTAYSVLACLDQMYDDDFEDWCSNYGYDTDSKTAEKTYNACLEQDRQLRRMFTLEELEKLAEIA